MNSADMFTCQMCAHSDIQQSGGTGPDGNNMWTG